MKLAEISTDFEAMAQRAAARNGRDAAPVVPQSSAPQEKQDAPAPVTIHKIESVTRQIDSFLRSMNHQLNFRVDQATGEMVVTVTDAETGEVIRQVPGEEALRMAQRIEDSLSGLLDEKA